MSEDGTETHGEGLPARPTYDELMRSGEEVGENHFVRRSYWVPSTGTLITMPKGSTPEAPHTFVGIHENHKKPGTDEWCGGYVMFLNVPEAHEAAAAHKPVKVKHNLVSADPLTLSPSLQCKLCPKHGFIRDGRWTDA